MSISSKLAKCSIFCIDDCVLPREFSATLRKEDMKDADYSKIVVWEYVKPGDIILARILGLGDIQTSYLLSIAEDELGVVNALGDNGERLVRSTLNKVKSPFSGYEEPRKVAYVPLLDKNYKVYSFVFFTSLFALFYLNFFIFHSGFFFKIFDVKVRNDRRFRTSSTKFNFYK